MSKDRTVKNSVDNSICRGCSDLVRYIRSGVAEFENPELSHDLDFQGASFA